MTKVYFWVVLHKHKSALGKWSVAPATFATRSATAWCVKDLRREGYAARPRRVEIRP